MQREKELKSGLGKEFIRNNYLKKQLIRILFPLSEVQFAPKGCIAVCVNSSALVPHYRTTYSISI